MISRASGPLALLAGLLATAPAQAAPLTAADARQAILKDRGRLWKDPPSIRDAKVTAPHPCPTIAGSTCVCLEANAKNSYGGFTGLSTSLIVFKDGKIDDVIEGLYPEGRAKCPAFTPFPELNGRK